MAETEVKEVQQLELGVAPDMASYNAARDKGETVIEIPVEKPADEEIKPADSESVKSEEQKQKEKEESTGSKKADARIAKATREKKEAEEQRDAIAREFEEFKAKNAKTQENHSTPKKGYDWPVDPNDPEPDESKFTDWKAYQIALNRWVYRQEDNAKVKAEEDRQKSEIREAQAKRDEELTKLHDDSIKEVMDADQDFKKWMEVDQWPTETQEQADAFEYFGKALKASKMSGRILHYYFENQKEFEKLRKMDSDRVVMKVASLADRLESSDKKEDTEDSDKTEDTQRDKTGRFISKSAPPIKPVNSGNTRSTTPLDRAPTMKEYNARRDAGHVR